ncbi:DnaA ATPase domain-containing protein [Brachyspira murdochii]|uniref:Sigma 54 interacting domain protein n=1 Tax=Brachyspira murdochii (strain ATCC 51284 / DSM 12563 / 56-150) TaxID=526224 RepID=D5UAT3_BRAM5|nr:DnaA/Hda family protein [Brachyspira murdochii]ADG71806.1 Sigma 54 interacting domain protein [Brachyspira murdochii DSM 12563]
MKRMLKLQIADSSYCLLSYKKHLEELKKTAREGKDPHCTKCDEFGFLKGSKSIVPIVCYCVSDEKSKIEKKIEDLEIIIKRYNTVFNKLDNDMTLNIFAEKFNNQKLVSSIKKYLELGSMNSLYIEGESGTGKTTMLKMLWQIYAINNIKALYMKASSFEDMHKNLFNKNAQDRDLKSSIDAKIDNIKFADIIMIDDIDSVGFHYAAEGYYKLFDKIRALEKTVILTSNKSYDDLLKSLNKKTDSEYMKGRLTSRLLNLKIIEIEMQKFEIKSDKLAS